MKIIYRQSLEKSGSINSHNGWQGTLLFTVVSAVWLDIVLKFLILGPVGLGDILLSCVFNITFGLLLGGFCIMLPKVPQKVASSIVIFGMCLVTGSQLIFYRLYYSLFSIYSMFNGAGQVMEFIITILRTMLDNWWGLLIILLPFIIRLVCIKRIPAGCSVKAGLALLCVSLVLFVTLPMCFSKADNDRYSRYRLYNSVDAPLMNLRRFGLPETMIIDGWRYFAGFEEESELRPAVPAVVPVEPENDTSDDEPEIAKPAEPEYNVIEIDFDSLIAGDANDTVRTMHEYFKNSVPTAKNEYTGIFKGKNLIMIVAESFSAAAVDPNLTPTLYKMVQDGFTFTNYYNPVYYVSTYDGEYVALLSLLPKSGCWSMYWTKDNYLPYSLGNMTGSLGYHTAGYHDGEYNYYSRDESHPNLGFKWTAIGSGLNVRYTWPESDVEMMEKTVGEYVLSEPFYTYYLTISGHLNYNFMTEFGGGNAMAVKHKDEVAYLPYSDPVKAYLATQIEFNNAMETLLDMLDEAGTLDDTVIVITPDHYPYGLTDTEMKELVPDMEDIKYDIHRGSLVVYNHGYKGPTIDKYCANLDILPTIMNLFGVKYDSRLLMGRDILSDSEGIVILNDRSWKTSRGRYNSVTDVFYPSDPDDTDHAEYVDALNDDVYNRFLISKLVLDNDYYSLLPSEIFEQ